MATPDRKDSEWLKDQLVLLMEEAMAQVPRDHAVCIKCGELLHKLLPKGVPDDNKSTVLDDIRKAVLEVGKPKKKT